MGKILVQGGVPLHGRIRVKGSKNASLPIIAAAMLTDEQVVIEDVPDLLDVRTMINVLRSLGVEASYNPHTETVKVCARRVKYSQPPPQLIQQMRASFLVLGPMLSRKKQVRLTLPGGCAIGARPVDLHLKGLTALGARFTIDQGLIVAETEGLRGGYIYLDYPSVGATENIIMAAAAAPGATTLENAATEPEIVDLANFINSMGGRISGAGTSSIRIEGVEEFHGTRYTVIPDRIEAGTLLLAGAITGGEITVENVVPEHLKSLLAKLRETGALVEEIGSSTLRAGSIGRTAAVDLKTLPYPGFPTDLQPQFMALLCTSRGTSMVTETVFENRFQHVSELVRMGARIQIDGNHAIIQGQPYLTGAPVRAADLRAAAALLLAALGARGVTEISGAVHLWRGYSGLEERLQKVGARIQVVSAPDCQKREQRSC
ncbi:MAG TPA: UDP-N-acetylglucosamine 1-carboxyvinyltransferase [Bacillota bacterium]|jgi:UDP-N-acetylglucosamine 1-carboxyvinyltransferase|nr:UDP-N-acetylglucosamine 1-carboxyvinyltransferase [Bacillota bacterium]HOB86226.1 UDP-N-acetylglucosamine 1-carboxyvinyltransferase [Bacillota bacterium]HOP68203.1 UDP-N-acetylglucosamine 1-carboxyvinyltransferase [Bacillota bacterium]HPT33073.1 UDP-N-acetylglucosamine 1-carboxyvinyltransferase [Bacillota bacterium]HQD05223.1 UDP-N-acetylglucosamine 1-carboxyvinyltransferase [Bacillota bacterium]